jgi:adenosine/AMP kinase
VFVSVCFSECVCVLVSVCVSSRTSTSTSTSTVYCIKLMTAVPMNLLNKIKSQCKQSICCVADPAVIFRVPAEKFFTALIGCGCRKKGRIHSISF